MSIIPDSLARQLVELDEQMIKSAADEVDDPENNFQRLLFLGNVYRRHGLSPIYLATPDMENLTVSCRETFMQRLH